MTGFYLEVKMAGVNGKYRGKDKTQGNDSLLGKIMFIINSMHSKKGNQGDDKCKGGGKNQK